MKKSAAFFIFVIFILFAFLGYNAAAKAKQGTSNSSYPANSATALATVQQNYLLIHVDDLTQKNPRLIAVWGAFVYYSQPNQIMFLPLLPSYDASINDPLYKAFSIQKNGQVSGSFLDLVQKKLNFQLTGIVVVDSTGLASFNRWLTGQENPIVAAKPENDDQKHALLLNAQTFFNGLCSKLQNPSPDWTNAVDWTAVAPTHFFTSLPFETIMVDMQKLSSSGTTNQCSVLSSE